MSEHFQASAPIIPVIDERLDYAPTAPQDHKIKVQRYNDLLEDIYQREVELSNIKSALLDMRQEITEEAHILENTDVNGIIIAQQLQATQAVGSHDAARSDSSSLASSSSDASDVDSAERALAVASAAEGRGVNVKVSKKTKTKAKSARRSKVPDARLGGEWDYKLDISTKRAQRAGSDESESEDD
ncbi:hypothetical protein CPB84DRAFT_1962186 [Gymnopilus junonius]|uniref:Uncharacterized protein n=1 Tax=Gymnopilus junonius TaxID=109634 RepID=A0A9P5NPS3_GYMJU|nr:hypothetical protein CPB84DRAFT_1962186 [Gymnopilus junonius]